MKYRINDCYNNVFELSESEVLEVTTARFDSVEDATHYIINMTHCDDALSCYEVVSV